MDLEGGILVAEGRTIYILTSWWANTGSLVKVMIRGKRVVSLFALRIDIDTRRTHAVEDRHTHVDAAR
jgi:hypothetical protein